jgi:hypothetical protein
MYFWYIIWWDPLLMRKDGSLALFLPMQSYSFYEAFSDLSWSLLTIVCVIGLM